MNELSEEHKQKFNCGGIRMRLWALILCSTTGKVVIVSCCSTAGASKDRKFGA